MQQRLGKKDIIFIVLLLLIGLGSWGILHFMLEQAGNEVIVTVDSVEYGRYPLDQDMQIPIKIQGKTTNVLNIQDKKADMIEADCPDKLCVHQNAISSVGESIVCLPNRVVVTVAGTNGQEVDTIAK